MKDKIIILYVSQTGNAQHVASHLANTLQARGILAKSVNADEQVEKKNLQEFENDLKSSFVVLVCSTTGDGDVPDNGTKFYRYLKKLTKSEDAGLWKDVHYTLLGLGDTNYDTFCGGAKRLDRELMKLGVNVIHPKGYADDAVGIELVVEPWIRGFVQAVISQGLAKLDQAKYAAWQNQAQSGAKQDEDGLKKKEENKVVDIPLVVSGEVLTPAVNTSSEVNLPTFIPPTIPQIALLKADTPDLILPTPSGTPAPRPPSPIVKSDFQYPSDLPMEPKKPLEIDTTPLHRPVNPVKQLTSVTRLPPSHVSLLPKSGRVLDLDNWKDVVDYVYAGKWTDWIQPRPGWEKLTLTEKTFVSENKTNTEGVMEISLSKPSFFNDLLPGDAVTLLLPNPPALVLSFLQYLNIQDPFQKMDLVLGGPSPFNVDLVPSSICPFNLVSLMVNLTPHVLSKPLLRLLANHSTSATEKRILLFLCSREGLASYQALNRSLPSLMELCKTFPTSFQDLGLERLGPLLTVLPLASHRTYSITHGVQDAYVKIALKNEYTIVRDAMTVGLASSHLFSAKLDASLWAMRRSGGKFSWQQGDEPLNHLAIAAGTGITPFVAFARSKSCENMLLLHGHRTKQDGLYRDAKVFEFVEPTNTKGKAIVWETLSREGKGQYVQDLIANHGDDLYKYLFAKGSEEREVDVDGKSVKTIVPKARLLVCGKASTMARGVHQALIDLIGREQQVDKAQAELIIKAWMEEGIYVRDLWG